MQRQTRPRVSICVPNLNTRAFLPERFATIFAQTFQDWELLVYDSHSTDGAWEYISGLTVHEPRMRAWQGPREGTPGSWTPCVREAIGEYVYVATSDDTMPPDCLEKLVRALDAHPECQVAHCPLHPIDEHGHTDQRLRDWWWHGSSFALSSRSLIDVPHIRRAPFDGVLHLLGGSVYVSVTQLLVRRTLFDTIGYFQGTWGSVGDFNWCMRAGLVADAVHVPDTWGGWRVHATQATAGVTFGSRAHAVIVDAMIEDALAAAGPVLADAVRAELTTLSVEARALRALTHEIATRSGGSPLARGTFLLTELLNGSPTARDYVAGRLLRRSSIDWVRRRLHASAAARPLVPITIAGSSRVQLAPRSTETIHDT